MKVETKFIVVIMVIGMLFAVGLKLAWSQELPQKPPTKAELEQLLPKLQ